MYNLVRVLAHGFRFYRFQKVHVSYLTALFPLFYMRNINNKYYNKISLFPPSHNPAAGNFAPCNQRKKLFTTSSQLLMPDIPAFPSVAASRQFVLLIPLWTIKYKRQAILKKEVVFSFRVNEPLPSLKI